MHLSLSKTSGKNTSITSKYIVTDHNNNIIIVVQMNYTYGIDLLFLIDNVTTVLLCVCVCIGVV